MYDAKPFLDGLYKKAKLRLAAPLNAADLDGWNKALSGALWRCLGMDKLPLSETSKHILRAAAIIEETESGNFILRLVSLEDAYGYKLPCYVIFPKNINIDNEKSLIPAAVALHGHGYGARSAAGLPPRGGAAPFESSGLDFALKIAGKGFAAAVPELLGFGERRLPEFSKAPPEESACLRIASQLMLYGETLAARRVYDAMLSLDYLFSINGIKKDGACAMGFSGGAMICMLLSIFDKRIKRAALACYPNLFKTSIIAMRHCIDNYIPGILEYTEMPGLLSLIAPRPLFLSAGINDPIFPFEGAKEAFIQTLRVYKLYGAEKNLVFETFEGGHQIFDGKIYDWLSENN